MKKTISVICIAVLLMNVFSVLVFAGGNKEIKIPEYEPWLMMQTAAWGSCAECDPDYGLQYNMELQEKQRRSEAEAASKWASNPGKNPFKNMDGFDILLGGTLAVGLTMFVMSMIDTPEFTKAAK